MSGLREAKGLEFDVVILKREIKSKGGLGVGFVHNDDGYGDDKIGCKVKTVKAGGAAAATGKIISHDWLLAVNGKDVRTDDKAHVITALKAAMNEANKPVTLRFRRSEDCEEARVANAIAANATVAAPGAFQANPARERRPSVKDMAELIDQTVTKKTKLLSPLTPLKKARGRANHSTVSGETKGESKGGDGNTYTATFNESPVGFSLQVRKSDPPLPPPPVAACPSVCVRVCVCVCACVAAVTHRPRKLTYVPQPRTAEHVLGPNTRTCTLFMRYSRCRFTHRCASASGPMPCKRSCSRG